KPVDQGGSEGRTEATGYGGVYALMALLQRLGRQHQGMTVAVQGMGNVGYYAAQLLQELGFLVVAVSDSKGAVYRPAGLPPMGQIAVAKQQSGSLLAADLDATSISNDELLALEVDILLPA